MWLASFIWEIRHEIKKHKVMWKSDEKNTLICINCNEERVV